VTTPASTTAPVSTASNPSASAALVQTAVGAMTIAQAAREATQRSTSTPEIAMDSSVLIAATQEGRETAVTVALGTRIPVVSPTAFAESTVKMGPGPLQVWMAANQARPGLPADPLLVAALQTLGIKGGNAGGDAGVAASAMEELLPILVGDRPFFQALTRIGYPGQFLPTP